MRQARQPGAPIDSKRYEAWLNRFDGYRQKVTKKRINSWLEQFAYADKDVAARMLDCVEFISGEQLEQGLAAVVSRLPGWHPTKRKRDGTWRFVPFSKSGIDSGHAMLYRLRSAIGLNSNQHHYLFIDKRDLLGEELTPDDSVVFVDDFAGSGAQATTDWPELMDELLPGQPKVYLVLVAACMAGIEKIHARTRMSVRRWRTLRTHEDVFSSECTQFDDADKAKILQYCRRADRKHPRGFGDCGLLFVLPHKTPNNSLPILHKNGQRWQGLFPR